MLGIGERNGIALIGGLIACLAMVDHKYIQNKYRVDMLGYIEKPVAQAVGVEISFNNYEIS